MDFFRIGFIIADKDELKSIDFTGLGIFPKTMEYHGMEKVEFFLPTQNSQICVDIVLCGIGLACAASAASYLAADNYNIIINAGLSGSISKLCKDDIFICEKIAEHDADLTSIGFKPGERPGLPVFFNCDKRLVEFFKNAIKNSKCGISASGNEFIASYEKKEYIKNNFGALCCDMEASAIALVCSRENIPFVSVRKISDSADDAASDDYKNYDINNTSSLFDIVINALRVFPVSEF